MSTLKDLRTRRTSVEFIRKMTAAMKAVAGAKLFRAQNAWKKSVASENDVASWAQHALSAVKTPPAWLAIPETNDRILVVIGVEFGFCGSLNNRVVSAALEHSVFAKKVVFFGTKGADAFSRRSTKPIALKPEKASRGGFQNQDVADVEKLCLDALLNQKNVWVCYPAFRSALAQEIVCVPLMPTLQPYDASAATPLVPLGDGHDGQIGFVPSPESVLNTLLPLLVHARLQTFLWEAFTSEQSARLSAMKDASKNAQDVLDHLKISYNRTRQSKITLELIEIIAGAEHA